MSHHSSSVLHSNVRLFWEEDSHNKQKREKKAGTIQTFWKVRGRRRTKNDPFLNVGFKRGTKWVDKNGAKCNMGLGHLTENTLQTGHTDTNRCLSPLHLKRTSLLIKEVYHVETANEVLRIENLEAVDALKENWPTESC